jgi:hypothetical protein
MEEGQYACNRAILFGKNIVALVTKCGLNYLTPTSFMKKGASWPGKYEAIPRFILSAT